MQAKQEWERIKELFGAVLEHDPAERAAFLQAACGTDLSLRQEVESLIKAHESSANLWEHPLRPEPSENKEGRFIGPYQLIKKIGEGGMGQVWLAQQTAPLHRQVALKLIRWGMPGQTLLHRFQAERQSLAVMDHPSIAKVFDAGATPDGQPYFVMEYVAGVPITEYCDEKRLGIRERLELFIKVCEGVQHAHQKAIIHRDLKPANILVTDVDGKPVPRIIDFGLAKAVTGETAEGTVLTAMGNFVGTPGYMSPEQCSPAVQDIDTRTDVYSLGMVLYVLLAGSLPFETGEWKNQPLDEILRRLREEDPPAPSTKVSADYESSSAAAEARGTGPKQLVIALRGDLDWITMKALEKERSRRYASPSDFAADIQRYLDHEAVLAVPPSLAYRTTKFVRRNRTVVVTAAAALVLVIGSLTTGLLVANRERKIAEQRFAQVRQLANKFIALDNDIRGLPGSTKVRMQLVSDAQQYLTSLGSDVQGDRDLALDIAYAYVRVAHAQGDPTSPNLGQFGEAVTSLNKASTFVDPILAKSPNDRRALFIATTIAHDRMALADYLGDQEEALSDAPVTAALIERFMSTRPVEFHDLFSMRYFYSNVANAYLDARHFDEAVRYCRRALDIPLSGPRANAVRGAILDIWAAARWESGDLDGALKTNLDSIELKKAEAAEGHASLLMNLANGYALEGSILGRADSTPSLGRRREALTYFQKALEIADDLAKKDSLDYLSRNSEAMFGCEIGNILRHTDPHNALLAYDHALMRIREVKANPNTQLDEAELLVASSYPLRWIGREKEARERIEKTLELLQDAKRYSVDKVEPMSETYDLLRARADDYAETGETAKAIQAYQDLLDKLTAWKSDPQNDLRDATCFSRTWTALAGLLRRSGRTEEADRLVAQRMELWNHWNGKLPNAQPLLRQSLDQIALHASSPAAF